jgi:hypothetical protein
MLGAHKKAAGWGAGGFFGAARRLHRKRINASRIALRDVLCADQLFYARLHVRHG